MTFDQGAALQFEAERDLQGTFGALSFSTVFRMLRLSRMTGTLTLYSGSSRRTVSFEQGRIRYLTGLAGPLPVTSVRQRHIRIVLSPEQVAALNDRGLKLDDSIISQLHLSGLAGDEKPYLSPEKMLRIWITRLILWRNCSFIFDADNLVHTGGFSVDRQMAKRLIEGVRRIDAWIEMLPVVPSAHLAYRWTPNRQNGPPQSDLLQLFIFINGKRSISTIATQTGICQFKVVRGHYLLGRDGFIEPVPIDRQKLVVLFSYLIESIYLRLTLLGQTRLAFELERDLDRFSLSHGLRVRMAGGRTSDTDQDSPLSSTNLIDLYKLFFLMQADKLMISLVPDLAKRIIDVLQPYHDPESRRILRMFAFAEIEELLNNEVPGPVTPPRGS